jgi:glycosyltransferase involved in cell wall biosynthesis
MILGKQMALKTEIKKLKNLVLSFFDLTSFLEQKQNPKISANILCKNNKKSIEICLKSIVPCINEIVIIDTGSTDGTIEVIEKFFQGNPCQYKLIKETKFKGYSYHRNQAIKESSGDWILVLDSDEYLSKEFQKKIKKLCSSYLFSAYKIFRRWISKIETDSAQYTNTQKYKGRYKSIIRLFKKLPSVEYRGDIHEAVFGLDGKRIKMLDKKTCFYHLDVAINSYQERKDKVEKREAMLKGSGHPEEYLPEDFEIEYKQVPQEDFIILGKTNGKVSQKTS